MPFQNKISGSTPKIYGEGINGWICYKDERRSDGVPEQPAEDLQIIDRLENIAEQMMPDKEKRSDGVPVQPAGVLQIIDRLENSAQQMLQG